MQILKNPAKETWSEVLKRPMQDPEQIRESVTTILDDVRKNGDFAVKKYTRALDGAELEDLLVSPAAIQKAGYELDDSLKEAIRSSAANIRKFHEAQNGGDIEVDVQPGLRCWQKAVPMDRIGIYIPGGSAPLFSSVLMMAVPARVAGCKDIVLITPPDEQGGVHPAILYAAAQSGVDRIFRVGGAQAIAAMAYGTDTIPQVNKIFGPGNQFVTLAKQLVSIEGIAIDLPAGPSEVLVVADANTPSEFIAADLLSQAEHGPDSQVILIADDQELIDRVKSSVEDMMQQLPKHRIIRKALESSKLIFLPDQRQIMDMVNYYAPEHLILATKNAGELAAEVRNAGSVFIGRYTPESLGDYASGTNHVLPTNGAAKGYSGVNIDSFMKKITFQKAEKSGLEDMAATTMEMAKAEGLEAHRKAVEIRMNHQKTKV